MTSTPRSRLQASILGRAARARWRPHSSAGGVFVEVSLLPGGPGLGPGQLRLVEALAGYAATIVDNVESYVRERDARATAEALVKERQRVAMDLHDGIIQSLYGVVLLLGAARREPEVTDETRTALDQAIEHISEVIEEGRGYIHDLRSLTEQRQEICSSVRQLAR